jgi:hypothetical protein
MAKRRTSIPKKAREQVLKEFNHRCAVCGGDRPQLHHIDEDPEHNDPDNLLPLCANHHLSDQHDPTRRVEPAILSLFRRYRDPAVLEPQFVPLFERFRFLYDIAPDVGLGRLFRRVEDLTRFVGVLAMGEYYAPKLGGLLQDPAVGFMGAMAVNPIERAKIEEGYRTKLRESVGDVEHLIMELLRFQDWRQPTTR